MGSNFPRPRGSRPLTAREWQLVQARTTEAGRPDEQVARVRNEPLLRSSLRRLQPNVWLNDEVINAYTALLKARERRLAAAAPTGAATGHIYSTFFYNKMLNPDHGEASLANRYDYASVRR